jgi:hypothetical protein
MTATTRTSRKMGLADNSREDPGALIVALWLRAERPEHLVRVDPHAVPTGDDHPRQA